MKKNIIPYILLFSVICVCNLFSEQDQGKESKPIKMFINAKDNVLNTQNKSFTPASIRLMAGKYKITAEVDAYYAESNKLPAKKVTFSAFTGLGADGYTWVLKDGETIKIETIETDAFGYFVEGASNDNTGGATLTLIKIQ
jgi:hypothetical protein